MHKNTDDISLNNNFNDDILNTGKKGQKKKNKRKVSISITLYILTGREIMFLLTLTLPLQKLITAHPDSHAMIMVL